MGFDKVKELMDSAVRAYGIPGSDIIVTHNGKEIYRYWNGTRDDERKIPVRGDELYFLYSTSKVITCTAAMQLLEKGKLKLENKLSDYIPEFKNMWVKTEDNIKKAEKQILLKHLFTMTSGLNYNLRTKSVLQQKAENPNSSTLEMVKSFAREPLDFEPGEHYQYSLSHDVLAAVVEVAAEQYYGEYLKKHIFDVCGMERTGFSVNSDIKERMASQFQWEASIHDSKLIEKNNEFILTPNYESGGAGLISCVDDYCKFATMMANTNRLLKPESMNLIRTNHLAGQAYRDFQMSKPGYGYGLGVRTDYTGKFVAKGEFGWDGAAGAYVLIDPDNKIAIFYATHVRDHGDYLYNNLHPAIRNAIYEALLGK